MVLDKKNVFVSAVLIICFGVLVYFALTNEICEGGADNYWHYFFSKYAFEHPQFFLHHWGKPIYILLTCAFAQFGIIGIKIFNIGCSIGSALVCYRFCKDVGLKMDWIVILLLVFSPLYFLAAPTALTEPLFSFLLISSSYLFFRNQFFWGAILASFLFFSRTEGIFIICYLSFYLLLSKNIKYIPLLASSFVLYGLVGYFAGHSFFWFFTEIPYSVESPYGLGNWLHFFRLYDTIWGLPHVILLMPGIICLFIAMFKSNEWNMLKGIGRNAKIFLLVFIPALLFFSFHVIAWRYGKFGSAGLDRVMVSITPYSAILSMYSVNLIGDLKLPKWISIIVMAVGIYFIVLMPAQVRSLPLKALNDEKAEKDAAEWLMKNGQKDAVIYYAHPAILFYSNLDPFDLKHNRECYMYEKACSVQKDSLFYYLWDSAFSEFACNTSTKDLENCPCMEKIKEFKEGNYRLYIYECKPRPIKNYSNNKVEISEEVIHLKASNGMFVCAEENDAPKVIANRSIAKEWETFSLIKFDSAECAIRAHDYHFFSVDIGSSQELTANRERIDLWETFTTVYLQNNKVALKAINGKYLSLEPKSQHIFATATDIGKNEQFEMQK